MVCRLPGQFAIGPFDPFLKLEPQRAPVDVAVIDSIRRPVEDYATAHRLRLFPTVRRFVTRHRDTEPVP